MSDESFADSVFRVVRHIPSGRVATYGQVAELAGRPRAARAVGRVLHGNPEPGVIPCHRVVFHDGSLAPGFAFGGAERQYALLSAEGVVFRCLAEESSDASSGRGDVPRRGDVSRRGDVRSPGDGVLRRVDLRVSQWRR
ncbi:MGMT family protein [uncultured Bifidobacterium sp.]|uniref:MGMT family protein n=1 Tax=uncultured Bifidobacterium sp. TaxID=165187 RepID=UPI0026289B64|nr:MGMT family protein [uncultured Bifidobacterium sp.]